MVIPEAAVEAAVYAYGIDEGKALEWERRMIVAILEASAPHLIREAQAVGWDEGYNLAQAEAFCDVDDETPNPYRSQK